MENWLRERLRLFWHRQLGRPYVLAAPIDATFGTGYTVVLLHGLGGTGEKWGDVTSALRHEPCRVIALDMLGFGSSPKPDHLGYNANDHARAVIAALRKYKVKGSVILVGHSMGCLIAVRVAARRPALVKHLILYQMPIYEGLPAGRDYSLRRDFYFWLYNRIIAKPSSLLISPFWSRVLHGTGMMLSAETLAPFVLSLRHTIMEQQTLVDMERVQVPMDVIYGALDLVVIRGNPKQVFARVLAPLGTHTKAHLHRLSPRASKFIAKRIIVAGR
jgi:pimeloyl-ACP methyl ester carboxylesterase